MPLLAILPTQIDAVDIIDTTDAPIRLHFVFKNVVLIVGDLKAIYTLTSTEQNEFGRSVWSDVWTDEDLKIMEYTADLKVTVKRLLFESV